VVEADQPAWQLEYEVKNSGADPIWLIVNEGLGLYREGRKIELSWARKKMRPNVAVFGYFDPEIKEVSAGESFRQAETITWPARLSDIWNAEREAAPPPGDYEVSIRIGYAATQEPPFVEVSEGVEDAVLNWQKEAASLPVRLEIPPYEIAP
jgi:hypothetical protein